MRFVEQSIKDGFNCLCKDDNGVPVLPVDLAKFKKLEDPEVKTNSHGVPYHVDKTQGYHRVIYMQVPPKDPLSSGKLKKPVPDEAPVGDVSLDNGDPVVPLSPEQVTEIASQDASPHILHIGTDPEIRHKPTRVIETQERQTFNFARPEPKIECYPEEFEVLHFHHDGDEIKEDLGISYNGGDTNLDKLQRLAEFLKENPTVKIKIAGHTDTSGSIAYNEALSERRSNSVISYLESKGVNLRQLELVPGGDRVDRVDVENHGELKNVVDTGDGVRELGNRRVEIEFEYNAPELMPQVVHNLHITDKAARHLNYGSTWKDNSNAGYLPAQLRFCVDDNAAVVYDDNGLVDGTSPMDYKYIGGAGELCLQSFHLNKGEHGEQANFKVVETTGPNDQTDYSLEIEIDGQDLISYELDVPVEDIKADNLNVGVNYLKPDGTTGFVPVPLDPNTMSATVDLTGPEPVVLDNNLPLSNAPVINTLNAPTM